MNPGRRQFLLATAGLGASVLADSLPTGAPQVEATATIFHAPPDGRNVLVRFSVNGVDAPAGRLRVFDRSRRALGTAGLLGVRGTLYGELWLPLTGEAWLTTEVETPATRGIIRTTHRLAPPRRWTLFWAPVADPIKLLERLRRDPDASTGGLAANPLPATGDPAALDHLPFLQLGADAARLEAEYGVPVSPVAVDLANAAGRVATLAMALTGAGVRLLARPQAAGTAFAWLQSPDGSRVLVANGQPGADPSALGFGAGGDEMARRIEAWLALPQFSRSAHPVDSVLLVSDGLTAGRAAVEEWNSRFAFPRIVVERVGEFVAAVERQAGGAPVAVPEPGTPEPPDAGTVSALAGVRAEGVRQRTDRLIELLAGLLSTRDSGIQAVADTLVYPVPGVLVLNPAPFTRTDLVMLPDGSERVITDVPPLGWVCLPAAGGGRWQSVPGPETLAIEGNYVSLRLDPETGAIRSLRSSFDGSEYARYPGVGLNAMDGARLEQTTLTRLPGAAVRLAARRRVGPALLVSTVTLYDDLPWVDLDNVLEPLSGAAAYQFGFDLERPRVRWEIPGGVDHSSGPVPQLTHLRWLELEGDGRVALLRGLDAPRAAVADDGVVVSHAPPTRARYRLVVGRAGTGDVDPWRFGWSADPMPAAAVPGTGPALLPSFGSLLVVDQPGALIVGLKRAADGDGAIVVLEEVLGVARPVTLGAAALRFQGGRLTDLLERDRDPLPLLGGTGIAIPLQASGVTAVRLTGISLAAG